MGTSKTLYGTVDTVPATEDEGWGDDVTRFLIDLIDGVEGTSIKKSGVVIPKVVNKAAAVYAAAGTVTPTHPEHVISGDGVAVTLSAVTAIGNGTAVGERLVLRGNSDTNTVTILDGANTVLNGLVTLALNDYIELEWNGSDWTEVSRSA